MKGTERGWGKFKDTGSKNERDRETKIDNLKGTERGWGKFKDTGSKNGRERQR